METRGGKLFGGVSVPAVVLVAVLTVATPSVVVAMQGRDARSLETCRTEIEQAGQAILAAMQADPNGLGPAPSSEAGNLAPASGFPGGEATDKRFIYFGYMFEDGKDFDVYRAYYLERMKDGAPFADAITLPKPREDGRNAILRLRRMDDSPEGSAWKSWYPHPSRVPVLYERSEVHNMRGSHVFFLDGHVEFVPHARTTIFPLAKGMPGNIRALDELQPGTSL